MRSAIRIIKPITDLKSGVLTPIPESSIKYESGNTGPN
jgi:hypothetical protein